MIKCAKFQSKFMIVVLLLVIFYFEPIHANEKPIRVFVSILPQAYFVEKIGGDRVLVDVFVLPGKSPATHAPTPTQISKLSKSDIFFRIGLPFENTFIPKIKPSAKHLKIIDTRKGVPLRKMEGAHDSHGHHHDHHHHSGNDPHIWLSPILAKIQAQTIYDALIEFDPGGEALYQSNYKKFINELDQIHHKLKASLSKVKGESIFVFHPSFGYFTDTYGLKQVAVEMEGKAPKGRELSLFIKKAKKENVHVIFVQPQFDKSAAQKIARAINGVVVTLDPLARDYIGNLERMAQKVSEALAN